MKAVFLDRDGVINRDTGYVHRIVDWDFISGAIEAMRRLHEAGYALVVVTNQSGIGRGYYTEADFTALTDHMRTELSHAGVPLAGIYFCPHLPDATVAAYKCNCSCRKPGPGLLLSAIADHGIDAAASIMIGDKSSDIAAGRAAGVRRCFLVGSSERSDTLGDGSFADLAACVDALLD